jgi:hypothetical protein
MANDDVQRLLLQVDANTTLLRQELNKARSGVDDFANRTESRLSGLQGAFGGAGRGAALLTRSLAGVAAGFVSVGAAAKLAVDSTREMQRLNAQLEVATGSTEAAGAAFQSLTKFAAETPFTLTQVTEAYIKLRNLGIEPTEARLRSFGNTSAAMGKDLMQFIEAVADAATGEFERLKEFGIRASKEGDKVRFTFQGVTEEVQFSADAISSYLQRLGETKFGEAMAKQAATIDGQLSNLSDATAGLGRALGALGIADATMASIRVMTDAIKLATEFAERLGRALGKADTSTRSGVITARMKAESELRTLPQVGGGAYAAQRRMVLQQEIAGYDRTLLEQEVKNPGLTDPMSRLFPLNSDGRFGAPKAKASAAKETNARAPHATRATQPIETVRETMLGGALPLDRKVANLQGLPEARADLEAIYDTLEDMTDLSPLDLIGQRQIDLASDYTRTLTEGLAQAVIYGRNFGDVLKGLAQQIFASGLINLLSGGTQGTSFGDSLGALGALFGGFREQGGPVSPGRAYVVGEKRPEVFVPSTSGYILPRVPQGGSEGGGMQGVTVRVEPSPLFITTVAGATQAAAGDAMRRQGRPRLPASAGA